ncbi:alpha-tocopherol transfer protein [Halyomorpha halys]|uniref:alpha-tocopherol transfer protein n=1 Tax=Halyomorpha halys TaxID=286706 RepID=UPI0006D4FCDE|nr:alpha-tocopherol transfer protein isoform X2 [Halyomorpha halys]XP_024220023.1 alpha-tocopherol transfer protein isoform X2 [Halyomorpha halys]
MRYPFKNLTNIVDKDKKEDIRHIREWLKHQQHLPDISDEYIMLFLHSNYFSLDRTKNTINSYFVARAENKELFTNWEVDALDFETYELVPIPKRSPEGFIVLLYRLRDPDPNKFIFQEGLRVFLSFNDLRISEDGLAPGYIVVFDMKGCSMGHLARATPYMNYIKAFMLYIQEAHPARLKGIHVINTVWFVDKIMNLVKPFIQSEVMEMLHFHHSLDTLKPFVPLELLPEEYGGDAKPGSVIHEEHTKFIKEEYKEWLLGCGSLLADLQKRPQKDKQDIMQGSFRSLSID